MLIRQQAFNIVVLSATQIHCITHKKKLNLYWTVSYLFVWTLKGARPNNHLPISKSGNEHDISNPYYLELF